MNRLETLPALRDVVQRHRLDAKKSLGQNFIFDLNLTGRIARAAGPLEGVTVIEVGPGPGGLTRSLLVEGASKVVVVERDERCLAALEEIAACASGRLSIVSADALDVDIASLARDFAIGSPVRLVANLPYNIAVPLLIRWVESEPWPPCFDRMTLMFQREVAERIVATPTARADYGRLAVLCGWRTKARILFDVPASAFTPAPKVTSSVVELIPRENPLSCDLATLEAVAQAAFGQRRKMLRQSLRGLNGLGYPINAASILEDVGLDATLRAEQLEIDDFIKIARRAKDLSDATRVPSRLSSPSPGPNKDRR